MQSARPPLPPAASTRLGTSGAAGEAPANGRGRGIARQKSAAASLLRGKRLPGRERRSSVGSTGSSGSEAALAALRIDNERETALTGVTGTGEEGFVHFGQNEADDEGSGKRNSLRASVRVGGSADWWEESEAVLLHKVQGDVFSNKGEQVVFVCKLLRLKKGSKEKKDLQRQLLVVCKAAPKSKEALIVHVMNLKGWSVRTSVALRTLRIIDGDPDLPFTTGIGDSNLIVKLEFHPKGTKQKFYFLMRTYKDKGALQYVFYELCSQMFGFEPSLVSINPSELQLQATEEDFIKRCALLDNKGGSVIIPEFFDGDRAREELAKDENDRDEETIQNQSGKSSHFATKQGMALKDILSVDEQEELGEILREEGLDNVSSGDLASRLSSLVNELEEESGDILRQWENRGNNSDYVGKTAVSPPTKGSTFFDPIALLVEQLEEVHQELTEMDSWMANYNLELRTMRKGVHKIENENNRLQTEARNHDALRMHLVKMLSHYAISPETTEVLSNLDQILREDTLEEVENGAKPKTGIPPAMERLSNTAAELRLALCGMAHFRHSKGQANGSLQTRREGDDDTYPEEPFIRATDERVQELRQMIDRFCGLVQFFIANRIRSNADAFRNTIASISQSHLNRLPRIVRQDNMHRTMVKYRNLIGSLQQLQDDSFQKAVTVYVQDMGEAYQDVIQNFFTVMKKLLGHQGRLEGVTPFYLTLADVQEARIGHELEERALSINLATNELSNGNDLNLSRGFAHCLEQLVPMIIDEQAFLGSTFYNLDEGGEKQEGNGNEKSNEVIGVQVLGQTLTGDEAVRERNATLESIFIGRCDILSELSSFVQTALTQAKWADIFAMFAEIEALNLEFGKKSKFLRYILVDESDGLKSQIERALGIWVEKQNAWIVSQGRDSRRMSGVLLPVRRLPRVVDGVECLWNVAAKKERPHCTRETYQSSSTIFSRNLVGLALTKLSTAVLQNVENRAVAKGEHQTTQILLENFHFVVETLSHRGGTALQSLLNEARTEFQVSHKQFVGKLVMDPFPKLIAFVEDVDVLLQQFEMSQIIFHKPRKELAGVFQALTPAEIRKKLHALLLAVEASLSKNVALFELIQESVKTTIKEKYRRYIHIIEAAYGDYVQPSAEEFAQLVDSMTA